MTNTTTKFVYTAVAPDGATLTRTSERNYPFAVAVLFGGKPERTVNRGGWFGPSDELPAGAVANGMIRNGQQFFRWDEVAPAYAPYWKVVSFHGTRAAAEKASPGYSGTVRKIVIPTEKVEKIIRHRS